MKRGDAFRSRLHSMPTERIREMLESVESSQVFDRSAKWYQAYRRELKRRERQGQQYRVRVIGGFDGTPVQEVPVEE